MLLHMLCLLLAYFLVSCRSQCTDTAGCFPPEGDLTLNRTITVKSNCTDEYYIDFDELQCDSVTNSTQSINDGDVDTMFGLNITDQGAIVIRLDFEIPVIFINSSITWHSAKPSAMRLERYNGTDWLTYRYYAENCSSSIYHSLIDDSLTFSTDPICEQFQNTYVVIFETSSHLSNDTPDNLSIDYQTVHRLRIVVDEIDEMDDVIAIAEWTVIGTCMCNGHASECFPIYGEDNKAVYAGCNCQHNTTGDHCDECSVGYTHRPWAAGNEKDANECQACDCNPEASIDTECNVTTGQCNCTEGAIGLQRMECPDTHYITTTSDQDYCMECFCFNHSNNCTGVDGTHNLTAVKDDFGSPFNTSDPTCSPPGNWIILPENSASCLPHEDGFAYFVYGQNVTLIAPESYHGDFKLSYGRSLTIVVMLGIYSVNENSYIRISNTDLQLYTRFPIPSSIEMEIRYTFMVPFEESYWRVGSVDGNIASLRDLIDVLVNVTDFRFSGKFANEIFEFDIIESVRWEYLHDVNVEPTADSTSLTVEYCTCPNGHEGQFCEDCMNGYYRMNDSLVESCIQCDCNGRADTCDTPTGTCINCTNNYDGDHCEDCLHGYYLNGMGCIPCDCDGQSCDTNGTCINCTIGYRGLQCDTCENGYYNNSGSCEACDCSGNVNVSNDPYCDPRTGECLNCTNNFQGFHCNMCENGYYTSNTESCQVCNCSIDGSLPNICDNTTGTCLCKDDNATPDCSECIASFYGNIALNETCAKCPCPSASNSHALSCSVTDGNVTCVCDDQYTGTNCDECRDGYFGDPLTGECVECDCSGSLCDKTTGLCDQCTEFTNGDRCEGCTNGYYGDPRGSIPCIPCTYCSDNGTIPEKCEMRYGSCFCKDNVVGDNCTECIEGTYGAPDLGITCQVCPCENIDNPICHLSDDMETPICDNCGPAYQGDLCQLCSNDYYNDTESDTCQSCQCNDNVDPSEGRVCDINNGVCTNCLYNTTGPNCEQCAVGYYGDAVNETCQECRCNMSGVDLSIVCHPKNGSCVCLPGVSGSTCSSCALGYWESNAVDNVGCQECNCCTAGSESSECDQVNGQCTCHVGVGGQQCCECATGYYGTVETGCTECECNATNAKVLSIECNSTGHCNCSEGAFGMKCDQCSFGYIDEGSSCSRCHDCFFLWDDIIVQLNQDAIKLLNRINEVMRFYKGFNNAMVDDSIMIIENTVQSVNVTLSMLSVETGVFENISNSLNQISDHYFELRVQSEGLNNSLLTAHYLLTEIQAFLTEDVSTNMIYSDILEYAALLQDLQSQANINLETIIANQQKLLELKATVNWYSNKTATAKEELSNHFANSNLSIEIGVSALGNLSAIEASLDLLENKINEFDNGVDENMNLEDLLMQLEMLDTTLVTFSQQLHSLSMLSEAAENSTIVVQKQADNVHRNTETIKKAADVSLASAKQLMEQIKSSQEQIPQIQMDLTDIKSIMQDLNEVSVPSADQAMSIAGAINTTIVPEQDVKEVVQDAQRALNTANKYLELAVNASIKADDLSNQVDSIQMNQQSSEALIEDIHWNFASTTSNINATDNTLEKLDETVSEFEKDYFVEAADTTQGDLESGATAIQELTNVADNAQEESTGIKGSVTSNKNKIEGEALTLADLKENAGNQMDSSINNRERAQRAKDSSVESRSDAAKVSLSDLKDLLDDYNQQLVDMTEAKEKIKSLETELQGLSSSFREASAKYRKCYKTP